eukprot:XP_012808990.1 PREDICTED: reticulon-3 isoform X1 [Xenopus tropicalis]
MIANSTGFDFKNTSGENTAAAHGLTYISSKTSYLYGSIEGVEPSDTGPVYAGISENDGNLSMTLDNALHTSEDICMRNTNVPDITHTSATHVSKPIDTQCGTLDLDDSHELYRSRTEEESNRGLCEESHLTCADTGETSSADILLSSSYGKRWQEVDEELDSSGESDDTVIDAGWRLKSTAAEKLENCEEGWVEIGGAQQKQELECDLLEGVGAMENEIAATQGNARPHIPNEWNKTEDISATTNPKTGLAKNALDSPNSEDFVFLAETSVINRFTEGTNQGKTDSLENQIQENLTIEALRALAVIGEDPESESRESSPEILYPIAQSGSAEALKMEVLQTYHKLPQVTDSPVDIATLKVQDLLYWRDVKQSGMVFGGTMVLLLSLAAFSIISVISYLVLSLLAVTISYRVYKSVLQAVQKTDEGHPFKPLLEKDIALSSDAFQKALSTSLAHVNHALKYIVRLFLVEDLVDSLKLALLMWLMTYVGAVFNGITLLILGVLLAFTAPIVYEKYKVQIDHYVSLVHSHVKSITEKIQAKLPGALKKKSE